jgi:hypothetical protein
MSGDESARSKQDSEWQRTTDLHEKYRSSGLALSVMIVTLSSAALNAIRPQGWLGFALFLPIALSIAHQTCIYMGQQHEARGSWKWFVYGMNAINLNALEPSDEARRRILRDQQEGVAIAGDKHRDGAALWFTRADRLCIAAAVSFIIGGAIAAMQLPAVIPGTK